MDYLYINTIVKESYVDLACGCAFPENVRKEMISVGTNDAFLMSKENCVYSCFTVGAENENAAPVLVMMQTARQKSSSSVGRYTQCIGWDWNKTFVTEGFDSVLSTGFYTEEELAQFAVVRTPVVLPKDRVNSFGKRQIDIDSRTLQAILFRVFLRWTKGTDPVCIAVPKTENYNDYALSAARIIYSYFPAALRMQTGFTTFLNLESEVPQQIGFGFVPEEKANNRTVFLDGSTQAAVNRFVEAGTRRESLDVFIRHLTTCPNEQRKAFLQGINRDVEGNADGSDDGRKLLKVNAKAYMPVGEALSARNLPWPEMSTLAEWTECQKKINEYPATVRGDLANHIRDSILAPETQAFVYQQAQFCDVNQIAQTVLAPFMYFCGQYLELSEQLWDTTLKCYKAKGLGYEDIYKLLAGNYKPLQNLLTEGRMRSLAHQKLLERIDAFISVKYSEEAQIKQSLEKCHELMDECVKLQLPEAYQKLKRYEEESLAIVGGIRLQKWTEDCRKVGQLPLTTSAELTTAIESANHVKLEIEQSEFASYGAELHAKLQKYVAACEEKKNSSSILLEKAGAEIAGSSSYFDAVCVPFKPEYKLLKDEDMQVLWQQVQAMKPNTLQSYTELFETIFQKKLRLPEVMGMPKPLKNTILEDLTGFRETEYTVKSGTPAAVVAAEIESLKSQLRVTTGSEKVTVIAQDKKLPAETALAVLMLKKQSQIPPAELSDALKSLASCCVFSGNDLMPVYCWMKENGLVDFPMLAGRGYFRPTTEKQYYEFFAATVGSKAENREKFVSVKQKVCAHSANNMEINQALSSLEKKIAADVRKQEEESRRKMQEGELRRKAQELEARLREQEAQMSHYHNHGHHAYEEEPEKTNSGKIMLIGLIVAVVIAVLAIGASVYLIFQLKNSAPEEVPETEATETVETVETTEETVPEETEPVVTEPVLNIDDAFVLERQFYFNMLFGSDENNTAFGHTSKAFGLLNGVQPGQFAQVTRAIMECYKQYPADAPVNIGNMTWGEYFYWKCWTHAGENAQDLLRIFSNGAFDEKTGMVVAAINMFLPVETADETTNEDGNTSTEGNAPTIEAEPLTLEMILSQALEVAEPNYLIAKENYFKYMAEKAIAEAEAAAAEAEAAQNAAEDTAASEPAETTETNAAEVPTAETSVPVTDTQPGGEDAMG